MFLSIYSLDGGHGGRVGEVHPAGGGDRGGREELSEHGPAAEAESSDAAGEEDSRAAAAGQGP